jgi:RNA polymerase sigma-70 factor, ECF subfamily
VFERIADSEPGPEARYEPRESVGLAFVAAIQSLPPRQRAVLLLRDVLGWNASETADALGMSIAAANSALQRARSSVPDRQQAIHVSRSLQTPVDPGRRRLLDGCVRAWERSDVDGLVELIKEDATWTMPPGGRGTSGEMRSSASWAG